LHTITCFERAVKDGCRPLLVQSTHQL
jgi:hypothetical protein